MMLLKMYREWAGCAEGTLVTEVVVVQVVHTRVWHGGGCIECEGGQHRGSPHGSEIMSC